MITIPDFTQDNMDTTPSTSTESDNPVYAKRSHPDVPNIAKVLETRDYGLSALWVSELRRRLGMTQNQIASALGVSSATYGSWERGESQPSHADHRASLMRAGRARGMPDLPERIGDNNWARNAGPRIDPRTEELFKQHFGG